MTTYERTIQLVEQLTLQEKLRLLQQLGASLQKDVEAEAYKSIPWEQFLDATYGILADDPIERNQPLYSDERDPIE